MSSKESAATTAKASGIPPEMLGRELSDAVIFFHEAIASHLGMSVAEWKCLGLLERHGASTPGHLAELSGFTTGAITGIVDRLERGGYVRRERHPHDRRSIIVQPVRVKSVQEKVAPIFRSLQAAMAGIASRYGPAELAVVSSYFVAVTQALRDETLKLRRESREPQSARSGGTKVTRQETRQIDQQAGREKS